MMFKDNNYVKYICLIGIILIQISNCYAQETKPISCIQCGGNGEACKTDISETAKECPDLTFTQCFTQIDTNGNIERGCKTDESAKTCTAENNCVLSKSGENNQMICKKCEASDANCSQTEMKLNELKYNEICAAGITECLMKVDDNKLIVRGCNTDKTKCTDENVCKTCTGVNCNTGIYPTKRIHCYQCSGSSCVDVTSLTSKPCLKYVSDDKCYTLGKSETDMIRGCQSDATDNQCTTTNKDCLFCTSDNCNNLKYKYDQKLKCHQCSSSDADNDCFKEQTGKEFKNCEKQIAYNDEEYCYSHVDDSGTIQRGCLHDNDKVTIDNCKDNDDVCIKCNNPDGCNSKAMSSTFTCIVCRSDLESKCWNEADKLEGKTCRTGESSAKDGCFHGIWNGIAIRGCLIDASIQNQEICKDKNNHQCNLCNAKNCNIDKSGSSSITLHFALILIALTTLWNFK